MCPQEAHLNTETPVSVRGGERQTTATPARAAAGAPVPDTADARAGGTVQDQSTAQRSASPFPKRTEPPERWHSIRVHGAEMGRAQKEANQPLSGPKRGHSFGVGSPADRTAGRSWGPTTTPPPARPPQATVAGPTSTLAPLGHQSGWRGCLTSSDVPPSRQSRDHTERVLRSQRKDMGGGAGGRTALDTHVRERLTAAQLRSGVRGAADAKDAD